MTTLIIRTLIWFNVALNIVILMKVSQQNPEKIRKLSYLSNQKINYLIDNLHADNNGYNILNELKI